MKTNQSPVVHSHPGGRQYVLRRGLGFWQVTCEGRQAIFKHELGVLYVA